MKIIFVTCLFTFFCMMPCCAQQKQHGKASFYSKKSTGARTASGLRLHHDSLTCAHRFYPFGTMLKVTNLSNEKSVIVKVIDRGPFGKGRIIDLSWAAAKEIGMIAKGIASVKVEVIDNVVPYKPEDLNFPRIDFEMAEAGFSFIDKWKVQKENKDSKNKEAKEGKDKNVKESNKNTKETNKKHTAENKQEATEHKTPTNKQNKPKESSSWSNVFEKIKNWGNDIF